MQQTLHLSCQEQSLPGYQAPRTVLLSKRMAERFTSVYRAGNWKIFVEDKDAKDTKRSAKVARQVFQEYLKVKKTAEREERLLARSLKTFWVTLSFIAV